MKLSHKLKYLNDYIQNYTNILFLHTKYSMHQYRSSLYESTLWQYTICLQSTCSIIAALCEHSSFIDSIGYAEYPGRCDKLVQCYNYRGRDIAVLRDCPYGYFWHQEQVLCRPPAEVPCYDGSWSFFYFKFHTFFCNPFLMFFSILDRTTYHYTPRNS